MSVRFNEGTGTEGAILGNVDVEVQFKPTGDRTEGSMIGKYGVIPNIGSVVVGTDRDVTDDDGSGDSGVVIIGVIKVCRLGNTGVVMFANAGDGVHEDEVRDVIGERGFVVSKTEFVTCTSGFVLTKE